jgi:hypothetical protein
MPQKRKRITRPKPERSAPLRDFSTILREEGPPASDTDKSGAADQNARNDTLTDAVAQGARLGYSVIQEQLQQGRRVAQQWTQLARGGEGGPDNDITRLVQRVLHFSTDLGALLADLAEAAMRKQNGDGARGDAARAGKEPTADAGKNGAGTQICIDIEAPGRSVVMLDLNENAVDARLAVPGLYALDGQSAPLTAISFEPQALQVKIPGDQPAGTYTGVVVDRATNQPRGTLSIRLTR